nr:hypothetical protein GNFEDENH_00093 [Pseudomonas sp. QS1027]
MTLIVGAESVGLARAQRQLTVEPGVGVPGHAIAHHVVALARRVGETVEAGAVGRVAILVFGTAANESAVLPQARTDLGAGKGVATIGGGTVDGVLMGVIGAVAGGDFATFRGVVEDDIDHPGNGIGTVLGSCPVTQHFDALDGADGNRVEIHRRGTPADFRRVVDQRRSVLALAVDQDQHLVGTHAPQLRGPDMVGATGVGLARKVERRQQRLQGLPQFAANGAGGLQVSRGQYIHRHRRIEHGTVFSPRAGHQYGIQFIRGVIGTFFVG